MTYDVIIDGKNHRLELERPDGHWRCRLDGREIQLDAVLMRQDVLSILMDGVSYEVKRERMPTDLHLWVEGERYAAELHDPRSLRSRKASATDDQGAKKLKAPMPGKVVRLLVAEKTEVQAGQGVVVVEAMKMQNELKAPKTGIVQKILVAEGANVNAGDVLAVVE
jgi:biotin carboxyl carrier protein